MTSTANAVLGCCEPRIYTPPLGTLTLGDEATEFAARFLEIGVYPWQEWLLRHALELRHEWVDRALPPPFRYRTIVVLVARQNGKTLVLQVRALAGLFLWGERLAISLAQNRDVAFEPWREAALRCDSTPALKRKVKHIARSNGKECIELTNGARWKVVASNAGGRGLSGDVVLMDEVRQQHEWDAWSAVDYTRSARPHSQLWAFSNAGDDESVVLNELVRQGRECADDPERNPSLGYFEWSAREDADPTDVHAQAQANPSLGYSLRRDTIDAELATAPRESFLTERLCVRVSHLTSWLPPGLWESLAEPGASLPIGAPVTFAVDASPDLDLAVVSVASTLPTRRTHIELAQTLEPRGMESVPERVGPYVAQLLERHPGAVCVYDAHGPLAGTCDDLAHAGANMRALSNTEVRDACQRFHELAVARRIVHRGDMVLREHVANAVPSQYGGAWGFQRRSASGGPITALVAVVLAAHIAREHEVPQAKWAAY